MLESDPGYRRIHEQAVHRAMVPVKTKSHHVRVYVESKHLSLELGRLVVFERTPFRVKAIQKERDMSRAFDVEFSPEVLNRASECFVSRSGIVEPTVQTITEQNVVRPAIGPIGNGSAFVVGLHGQRTQSDLPVVVVVVTQRCGPVPLVIGIVTAAPVAEPPLVIVAIHGKNQAPLMQI